MKLIIDSNIIFSELMKKSITREILLSPNFTFYIPDFYNIELEKYKSAILEKFGGTEKELDELVKIIHEKIIVVVEEEYFDEMNRAEKIIGKIDPKDIPFIALALSIESKGIGALDKRLALFKAKFNTDLFYEGINL
ncbi:MAG: hypothetical protein GF317_02650 [Candidatus Lokiarchaeota archaeon]|nr:hypothetical protein [Candidatus Lokiarchaeota archaeon]MBD3198806.1 hypothetical protein [Candidatus Lokiarchaeota archaeon]